MQMLKLCKIFEFNCLLQKHILSSQFYFENQIRINKISFCQYFNRIFFFYLELDNIKPYSPAKQLRMTHQDFIPNMYEILMCLKLQYIISIYQPIPAHSWTQASSQTGSIVAVGKRDQVVSYFFYFLLKRLYNLINHSFV